MVEIACFNPESAIVAYQSGADRVEFCDGLEVGGTTPSFENTKELKTLLKIPIYVMIRPRGGDFYYSKEEFEIMKKDIIKFKTIGVDGFVFGILNENESIDVSRNSELVKLADGIPCTLHRAFDRTPLLEESLEQAIGCGFSTILTSGQKANVDEGKVQLKKLVNLANERIDILVGGGLRSQNIKEMKEFTQAKSFHSSAIINKSGIADSSEILALKDSLQ